MLLVTPSQSSIASLSGYEPPFKGFERKHSSLQKGKGINGGIQ